MMPNYFFLLIFFPILAFSAALPVEEVAPGIYLHRGEHKDLNAGYGGDICNAGFITGSNGVAVIDPGGSPKIGARLREAVRNITGLPVLYVINTHVHPDHTLGNAAFKQDHPVFVGHSRLSETMKQRRDLYLHNQLEWVGEDAKGSELIPPGLPVTDTYDIDLGGRILHLAAYPLAHSPTDLTIVDTASNTLWTGDLLVTERTPSVDGDLTGWLKVIDQLRMIPAKLTIPGHGPVTTNLSLALDDEQCYFDTLLFDVRAAIRQGHSMEDTIRTAGQSERGKWLLFDVINRRNVARIFPAMEWE